MRALILSALILLVSCGACGARQPTPLPTTSDPAVVKLVSSVNGEEAGYCTAWKIGDDRVMTAGHCCEKSSVDEVITYTAAGSHAVEGQLLEVLFDDDVHDVCVMSGKIKGAAIRFADHDPVIGEAVWTAGFPKTEYLISSGYWSGRDDDNKAKASVMVWGGASGSPVLNGNGEAVGVLVAYYPPIDNLAILTTLEYMKAAKAIANKPWRDQVFRELLNELGK